MLFNASDVVYGENATIIVNADVDGRYTVIVGDKRLIADVVNGEGDVEAALNAGSYDIAVEYVNDNYVNNVTSIPFTVSKADVALTVEVLDKVYTADVNGIVFASADGEYKVVIGNYEALVIVKDGVGSFDVGILNVGNYIASVSFLGDDNYNPNYNETAFEVTQTGTNFNIIANSTEIAYGGAVEIAQGLPGDATGSVTYSFANGTVIHVVGVNESFVLSGLNAGSYVVYANYSGDGNYAPAQDSIAVSVSKVDVTVSIEVLDKVYTANVNGNVFASIDGEYKVVIGNYETPVIVKDGVGSFDVGILNVGNYVAYVSFLGDDNYNSANNETAFEVTQTGTNFNIIANSTGITYGGAVEIAQGLPGDATGSVTYSFANGTVIKVVGVNESFVLSGLNAGSYVIYANYSGDGNYAPAIDSIAIIVDKAVNNVLVYSSDVVYGDVSNIVVVADVDGEYAVVVGDKRFIVDVVDGNGNVEIALDAGSYDIAVEYVNENYENNITAAPFTVSKADINLIVVAFDVVYPQEVKCVIYSSIDGEFNFTIGDYSTIVVVKNHFAELNLGVLDAGDYVVTVSYPGDLNHNFNLSSINVNVAKFTPNITLNVSDMDYGDVEAIIITSDIPGTVNVTVNGITQPVELNSTLNLYNLAAGSYLVTVVYNGDKNYGSVSISDEFNVNGVNATISIDAADIDAGDDEIIVVTLPDDATGNITVNVDGKNYIVPVKNGKATITIPDLKVGNKNANIYYSGDEKYYLTGDSVSFIVNKLKTNATINVPGDIKAGDNATVDVVIPDATGSISVIVDGNETVVHLVNGSVSVTLDNLSAGDHSIVVVYPGDETHAPTHSASSFKVEGEVIIPKVTTEFTYISLNSDLTINAVLKDIEGNPVSNVEVTYVVGNETATVKTAADGSFTIHAKNKEVVSLSYAGNDSLEGVNISIKVDVASESRLGSKFNVTEGISIKTYAVDTPAGEIGQTNLFLLTDSNGNPIANASVQFAYKTVILNRTTDENGIVFIGINTQVAQEALCAMSYLGDEKHNATFVAFSYDIQKKPITITASAKTYKTSAKTKKYTVTLKTQKCNSRDGKVYLSAGKKVTLKINGKTYTAKINAKGQATFNLKITKRGKFLTIIKFSGDKTYAAASKSVKISIK